jgi:hypothetical protein
MPLFIGFYLNPENQIDSIRMMQLSSFQIFLALAAGVGTQTSVVRKESGEIRII